MLHCKAKYTKFDSWCLSVCPFVRGQSDTWTCPFVYYMEYDTNCAYFARLVNFEQNYTTSNDQ